MIAAAKAGWWRLALVALIALGALAFEAPRLLYIGGYVAQLGAAFVHDVAVVPAGSAAAHAGMRTGDRLDTEKLTKLEAARFRYRYNLYRVGSIIDVPVVRANEPLVVAVTIERQRVPSFERFVWIVVTLWALVVLAVGCAIVIAHPNIVTAGFFAFTAGTMVVSSTNSYLVGIAGAAGVPYFQALTCLINFLGFAGTVTLCVRFPDGKISRSARMLELLGWAAALVIQLYYIYTNVSGKVPLINTVVYLGYAIPYWLVMVCFVAGFGMRYVTADSALRARLRWVGIGLASLVAQRAIFFAFNVGQWIPITYETMVLTSMVNVLPFTFAYAVFRQRVIDVRFAGGRAVLYAVVSAIPFGLFRMTDWLVRTDLEQARIAAAIEVLIAVAFGFGISLAQRRVDALVERTFFRARYQAEHVVREVIESLSLLRNRDEVDAAVVSACVQAMHFQSAAVFEHIGGSYLRRQAAGWGVGSIAIDETEPFVAKLRATKTVTYLDARDLPASEGDDRRPVMAVPVWCFDRLEAIVLVGRHRNGESPDPTEERIIRELARAAGIAYARITTAEHERTIVELRQKNSALEEKLHATGIS